MRHCPQPTVGHGVRPLQGGRRRVHQPVERKGGAERGRDVQPRLKPQEGRLLHQLSQHGTLGHLGEWVTFTFGCLTKSFLYNFWFHPSFCLSILLISTESNFCLLTKQSILNIQISSRHVRHLGEVQRGDRQQRRLEASRRGRPVLHLGLLLRNLVETGQKSQNTTKCTLIVLIYHLLACCSRDFIRSVGKVQECNLKWQRIFFFSKVHFLRLTLPWRYFSSRRTLFWKRRNAIRRRATFWTCARCWTDTWSWCRRSFSKVRTSNFAEKPFRRSQIFSSFSDEETTSPEILFWRQWLTRYKF